MINVIIVLAGLGVIVWLFASAPRKNPYWNKDIGKAMELDRREELLRTMCEPDIATLKMLSITNSKGRKQ